MNVVSSSPSSSFWNTFLELLEFPLRGGMAVGGVQPRGLSDEGGGGRGRDDDQGVKLGYGGGGIFAVGIYQSSKLVVCVVNGV